MTYYRKEAEKLRAEAGQSGSDSSSTVGAATTKSNPRAKRVTKTPASSKRGKKTTAASANGSSACKKRKVEHDTSSEDVDAIQDEYKDVHVPIEDSEDEMAIVHGFARAVKKDSPTL